MSSAVAVGLPDETAWPLPDICKHLPLYIDDGTEDFSRAVVVPAPPGTFRVVVMVEDYKGPSLSNDCQNVVTLGYDVPGLPLDVTQELVQRAVIEGVNRTKAERAAR